MSDSGTTMAAPRGGSRSRAATPGLDAPSREGSIEAGDVPMAITSSCRIRNEIYHMVTFKQRMVAGGTSTARVSVREQIRPRLYKSRVLRKFAVDFLFDFYESQIEWLDKPPTRKAAN